MDTSERDEMRLAEGFPAEESLELEAQAREGSSLDSELAGQIEHRAPAPTSLSSAYLSELGRRKRLSAEQERALIERARAGDSRARAQLVEAFLPLIGSVARNYRSSPQVTRLELMQEGVVGLLRALERFDTGHGVPFWAYAVWWVRQAMQHVISELTRPIVLSDRALRQLSTLKEAHAALTREYERVPTLLELADRSGLEPGQVANLMTVDRPTRALEESVTGDDGAIGTFGDLIADPLAEDEYERVVSHVTALELRELLSRLSERERAVLRARYGLEGEGETLRQIAARLGVSAERVRQLEQRALGKLRAAAVGAG